MKLFKSMFALASATLIIAACATQLPGSGLLQSNADFDLLSFDSPAFAQDQAMDEGQGRGGKGMRGPRNHMAGLFKKLNLSEEQKAQLKQMRQETHTDFKNNRGQHGQFKEIFKNAFLASKFDSAAVKAQITPLIANQKEMHSKKMANKIIQVYSILTPQQREQLYQQLDQMEKKMDSFSKLPFADKMLKGQGKRFEKMTSELGLNDAQKNQLKGLFEKSQPNRMAHFNEMRGVKDQLIKLFKAGTPSEGQVQSILSQGMTKMTTQLDQHLNMMAQVHDVLTPEQRQKLITQLESKASQRHQHRQNRHRQHAPSN
jgi:Spy/CpxP family protein refolding chaperone